MGEGTRHAFAATFVGKMTRDEFLAAHPTYAKLGKPRSRGYYIFKVTRQDYGPAEDGMSVVVRVYLPKDGMFTDDGEGTVDGCHPNDLGMKSMARTFGSAVRQALGLKGSKE